MHLSPQGWHLVHAHYCRLGQILSKIWFWKSSLWLSNFTRKKIMKKTIFLLLHKWLANLHVFTNICFYYLGGRTSVEGFSQSNSILKMFFFSFFMTFSNFHTLFFCIVKNWPSLLHNGYVCHLSLACANNLRICQ